MDLLFTRSQCSLCCISLVVVAVSCVLMLVRRRQRRTNRPSEATVSILTKIDDIEPACRRIAHALNDAAVVKDEKECAEQMREIVAGRSLEYSSLDTNPEYLLGCTRHISVSDHGALGTRFTVQYNLFAGSIVALGTDEQRQRLYDTQDNGELGCFAFTEIGAGVLSGAGVETTAHYDADRQVFIINSPTPTSRKTWISQGCFAEHAVILANLYMPSENEKDANKGPHLFFARIQNRNSQTGNLSPVSSAVEVTSLPQKTALWGLDNAYINFNKFEVRREDLLSRFSQVGADGNYSLNLPPGNKRMLDLLISRLLTGRVCLSEYTVAFSRALVRESWAYASRRELWVSPRHRATTKPSTMTEKPLIAATFINYSESLAIVASYIALTRERVAECIRASSFPPDVIEAVCVCKFVGTSFGVDAVSVMRKTMGSQALLEASRLGPSSFVCNATCAAEGDNTIMELKVVGDLVRGGIKALFPVNLISRTLMRALQLHLWDARACGSRVALIRYLYLVIRTFALGKAALEEGQLLRDLAWSRAHLLVIDSWYTGGLRRYGSQKGAESFMDSYMKVLMRYPTPPQF